MCKPHLPHELRHCEPYRCTHLQSAYARDDGKTQDSVLQLRTHTSPAVSGRHGAVCPAIHCEGGRRADCGLQVCRRACRHAPPAAVLPAASRRFTTAAGVCLNSQWDTTLISKCLRRLAAISDTDLTQVEGLACRRHAVPLSARRSMVAPLARLTACRPRLCARARRPGHARRRTAVRPAFNKQSLNQKGVVSPRYRICALLGTDGAHGSVAISQTQLGDLHGTGF